VIVLKKSNGRSFGNVLSTVSLVAISDDIRICGFEMLQAMDSEEELNYLRTIKLLLSENKKSTHKALNMLLN
jgi:hypothetical protein